METRITVYLVTVYQFLQYQESYLNVLGQFQKAQVPLKPIKGFSPILLVQSVIIEKPNMETRITVFLVTVYQFLHYQESYLNVLGQFQKAQVLLKPIKGFSPICLLTCQTRNHLILLIYLLLIRGKKGKRRVKTSNLSSKWSSTTLYAV